MFWKKKKMGDMKVRIDSLLAKRLHAKGIINLLPQPHFSSKGEILLRKICDE